MYKLIREFEDGQTNSANGDKEFSELKDFFKGKIDQIRNSIFN